jgi:cation diffusion facilitator family transporter
MSQPTLSPLAPDPTDSMSGASLIRWAWLSIGAAIVTMALKYGAYLVTGSVGLLSDAIESSVNLVAALTALFALWYAVRPVDRSHNYGHEKIEFFASAVEGGLILLAGGWIVWFSAKRLIEPRELESLGLGTAITLVSAVVNLLVARILHRVAREHGSIVLDADSRHLMTDVWTSLGVVAGLGLVSVTGVVRLDPLIGIAIALNILRTGFALLRTSFDGLMDRALPVEEEDQIRAAIQQELDPDILYHALRTRRAGSRRFVDLHVLLRGTTSLRDAHRIADRVEAAVGHALPGTETTVHLEPIEDPGAWNDSELLQVEGRTMGFDLPDFLQPPSRSAQPITRAETK